MNIPVYINPGNYGANPFDVLQKYIDNQIKNLRGQFTLMEQSSTFAAISSNKSTRFIKVSQDETNGNATTLYFYDGVALNLVITQPV